MWSKLRIFTLVAVYSVFCRSGVLQSFFSAFHGDVVCFRMAAVQLEHNSDTQAGSSEQRMHDRFTSFCVCVHVRAHRCECVCVPIHLQERK